MALRVGMYAHHQGSGHLKRCRAIAAHLAGDVTILSSLPDADVVLPLDVVPNQEHYCSPTAGDSLHWAPLGVASLRERMAQIARWIEQNQPHVFFVDVSVEVAQFVRLMGVPVVTVAMPGQRDDVPHQIMQRQAAALIAAAPTSVPTPAHLQAFEHKLFKVGGISSFDGRENSAPDVANNFAQGAEGKLRAVVLQGRGGTDWTDDYWRSVQEHCPGWAFTVLGSSLRVDNPVPYIDRADVVISAAGQNSVADIALTKTPAIFVPQSRAFNEQEQTAQVLENLGLAQVLWDLPAPQQWQQILAHHQEIPTPGVNWQVHDAAARAAKIIEQEGQRLWSA